jgi:type I restriction enzyme S subunit
MAWRPLAQLCANAIGPGPHPTFSSTGHPCLKTKNVLGVVIDAGDVDFVEHSDARKWPHYCIAREDLVLNVTGAGSIGRVAMYFGEDRPLTNQHLARLSIADGADAGFVCAFLSSWWGERVIEQGISGSTGQLNLVNDHIRQVPVPSPDLAAQRYIGDKVRQAERLRARARRLEAEFRETVAVAIPLHLKATSKTSRVSNAELGRNLNPGAHTPDRRAVRAAMRSAGGRALEELADVETPTSDAYADCAAYVGLDAIDPGSCRLQPSTARAEAVVGTARLLKEGPVISRLRPYLNWSF